MIPVFQLCDISSVIHIIVINLRMASISPPLPWLINSATICHSPSTLLFFVFLYTFSISSCAGIFTSSSSLYYSFCSCVFLVIFIALSFFLFFFII
jgi:hypothetical protein